MTQADAQSPPEVASESDMTPMVDVTFLLLIFFMVTAAFTLQKSLAVPPPPDPGQPGPVQQLDEADVIVEVDQFNTYHVSTEGWEREAPSEHELLAMLREARAGDKNGMIPTRLLVKAHSESLHEKVVAALDVGAVVGMQEVQLTTIDD